MEQQAAPVETESGAQNSNLMASSTPIRIGSCHGHASSGLNAGNESPTPGGTNSLVQPPAQQQQYQQQQQQQHQQQQQQQQQQPQHSSSVPISVGHIGQSAAPLQMGTVSASQSVAAAPTGGSVSSSVTPPNSAGLRQPGVFVCLPEDVKTREEITLEFYSI